MRPSSTLQRGVTLKAVIAALAIILVTFMLLFPRMSCGCMTPNAVCASNEKQIGLALMEYAQDNDERLPAGTQKLTANQAGLAHTIHGLGWAGQIYPYIKSTGVFHCEEDEARTPTSISYGYNSNVAQKMSSPTNGPGYLTDLTFPARTIMGFEISHDQANMTALDEGAAQGARTFSAAGDGTEGGLHSMSVGTPDPVQYAMGYPRQEIAAASPMQFPDMGGRHQGRANYLFADGHVKSLEPAQVSTGANAPAPTTPQTGLTTGTAAGTTSGEYTATFSVK